jgi:hypothetical protein
MPNQPEAFFAVILTQNCHNYIFFWPSLGFFALQGRQEWSKMPYFIQVYHPFEPIFGRSANLK